MNLELKHSDEMSPRTGMELERQLSWVNSKTCLPTFTYVIIGPYVQLLQTMQSQLQSSVQFMYSGEGLELERVSEPGSRLVYRLTLKTRGASGGVGIEIKNMLSWMSFEEVLTYLTSCDGVTDTLSVWKPKVVPGRCWQNKYGLPAMWILGAGTPI